MSRREKGDYSDSEISTQARKETYELLDGFRDMVENYFKKESIIPHNERFLVVSRAVNAYGVGWMNHFWLEMNPINKLEQPLKDA